MKLTIDTILENPDKIINKHYFNPEGVPPNSYIGSCYEYPSFFECGIYTSKGKFINLFMVPKEVK